MLALACGFIYAVCAVANRMLKETPTPVVLFYHTLGGFVATLMFLLLEMWIKGTKFKLFTAYSS